MGGFAEAQAGGQACEQNKKCGKHPRENNPHLPFLGQAHGGAAARDRVHDDHKSRADDGEIKSPAGADGLAKLAQRDIGDPDLRTAWLSSIAGQAGPLFVRLLADKKFNTQPAAGTLLNQLAAVAGAIPDGGHSGQVLSALTLTQDLTLAKQQALLQSLGDGLARRGKTIAALMQSVEITAETKAGVAAMFASAAKKVADTQLPLPERESAAGLLAFADPQVAQPVLSELLSPQYATPLQISAVKALSVLNPPGVDGLLLDGRRDVEPDESHRGVYASHGEPAGGRDAR